MPRNEGTCRAEETGKQTGVIRETILDECYQKTACFGSLTLVRIEHEQPPVCWKRKFWMWAIHAQGMIQFWGCVNRIIEPKDKRD